MEPLPPHPLLTGRGIDCRSQGAPLMNPHPHVTRRRFNLLMGSAGAALAGGSLVSHALADEAPIDVPWRSDDPHLSGNFLPVLRETDASDLRVISGRIPPDLRGVYMRNGPNPQFKPISFAYPLDGDGMIHAVYLEGGRARYRNRFVQTAGLGIERRVGRAVFPSFAHPAPIDPAVFRPGDVRAPVKNGAFVNIIRHGDHLLALNEATSCYEMSMDLETLGQWTAGTEQPIRLGAHNRRHPRTGDLYAIEYSWREPIVRVHQLNPSGLLVATRTVTLAMPSMIHDFILTERHVVLIVGPAVFDIAAARAGKSMLQWRPDLGMRIALLPLDGGEPTWVEGDPFFVYHFANGFERGGKIVVDYVHHDRFSFDAGPRATFRRMTIDTARRKLEVAAFSDDLTEFPRINHRHEALPTRYAYVPTLTSTLDLPEPPSATFNALLKFDTETGRSIRHDFGNLIVGEAAFVPRPGGTKEDDGYLAAFAYDPVQRSSRFVLLDARRIESEPVAVVALPQRVPQGLHGNWIERG
jgi:carotenoid cleavage dioxygenase-like enzyme